MTQEERVGSLIQKLRRCYRFIHNHADGGKWSQARALRQLRFHGEMTQRMLQEHMSKSAVAAAVILLIVVIPVRKLS